MRDNRREILTVMLCALCCGCTANFEVSPPSRTSETKTSGPDSSMHESFSSRFTPGQSFSTRSSVRNDGTRQRKVEVAGEVRFKNGRPKSWSKDSVITITETEGGSSRTGEMRPTADGLELKMKDKSGAYISATASDENWADQIFGVLKLDDTAEEIRMDELASMHMSHKDFRSELERIYKPTEKLSLLNKQLDAESLSPKDQEAAVKIILEKIYIEPDKNHLLTKLAQRKDFHDDARSYLLRNLDKVAPENRDAIHKLIKRK
ncbi:MAG: hypothetical protein K2W95_30885 [Candidatus Obscuribacterales bacterium]|nr:hypothetical protein [Candidatus Obscuribacterales bacterium]